MSYGSAPDPLMEAFWEGARGRHLMLQECAACGHRHFPPTAVCPQCLSGEQRWREASGRGQVASMVTFHQRYWDDRPTPYAVLLVELEEGPLIMGNPVASGASISIGDPVVAVFEARADGSIIPQFAPEPIPPTGP
ncbi:MAG TPA: OB-fold domain-containing protein [Phenylobacterium sp.]|uniref:Zn-ribbon domain-containing OB-fold protein n=1 Tax=Phenylobacterium sp. TaxID=1871053 RepID=UPI002B48228D|nr:OB-fold domain-containing protein [Phenylobacterium sp.]HKR90267.1 OB-fold domain-containing protein [Phenylobacterium sp.]HKT54011.1 OB-fold domain-containing protein [Caulobacteraceae bacterium]